MPNFNCRYACQVYSVLMELRHLKYFERVAQLRSVSKAAGVLHMTQPSLSRQIMELEKELDHRLFNRTSRGVELTAAGHGLYRHLSVVFAEIDRIPEVVRTAAQSRELLRVGVPQGLPHDWFLPRLEVVEEQLPTVSLSLQETTTDEQRQLLQNGLIDLALLHMEAPEAESVLLLEQAMGIAVTASSPLASMSHIGFEELDGLTVMAHAVGEIAAEEVRLRAASAEAGVNTNWVFRRFSEHSWLIARTAQVDAVLLTEASCARNLPGWTWIPVRLKGGPQGTLDIRTWATWNEPASAALRQVVEVFSG
jgi:DNA-binding transcriptional LysR family regulator